MDNTQKINDLQHQIERLQVQVAYLKAENYLRDLCESATYSSVVMAKYNDGNPVHDLGLHFYSFELLPQIKEAAKHFKRMDDSKDWPEWKAEAYKQAKVYDTYNKLQGWR